MKFIVKISPKNKTPVPNDFTGEFHSTFISTLANTREENTSLFIL